MKDQYINYGRKLPHAVKACIMTLIIMFLTMFGYLLMLEMNPSVTGPIIFMLLMAIGVAIGFFVTGSSKAGEKNYKRQKQNLILIIVLIATTGIFSSIVSGSSWIFPLGLTFGYCSTVFVVYLVYKNTPRIKDFFDGKLIEEKFRIYDALLFGVCMVVAFGVGVIVCAVVFEFNIEVLIEQIISLTISIAVTIICYKLQRLSKPGWFDKR